MPIYLVIYSSQYTQGGYVIKNIYRVIPTTFEEADKEIAKHRDILYNPHINPHMQCEYWMRHDESVLENAAKGN